MWGELEGPLSTGLMLREDLNIQGQIYIRVRRGTDFNSHMISILRIKCFSMSGKVTFYMLRSMGIQSVWGFTKLHFIDNVEISVPTAIICVHLFHLVLT